MRNLICTTIICLSAVVVQAAWTESARSTANSTITLSTVTTRVRTIIDDANSSTGSVRYSSATIYGLINTAQKMFCLNTRVLSTYATQSLVAGTTEYLLPSNCLYFEQITMDINEGNGDMVMPQKTTFQLAREDNTWTIEKSTPTAYYIRNRSIGFYPAPEFSGAVITIWYIKAPSDMDSEGDYIFDGYTTLEPYAEALADYAAYQILLLQGQTTLLPFLAQNYTDMIRVASELIKFNPDYLPSMGIPASPTHR